MTEAVRTTALPLNRRRQILRAATELRSALSAVDAATWQAATIDAFPRGACGHCAELLARYLLDQFGIEATYACGEVGHLIGTNTQWHAWLEHEGLFIDISADQFGQQPVIVESRSAFHEKAADVDRHPIIQDRWWGEYGARVYRAALAIIEAQMR
jgi:hypothetical protein